ncbi:MAG: HDIG domain-containing metalloprotein [Rectinema sp.]
MNRNRTRIAGIRNPELATRFRSDPQYFGVLAACILASVLALMLAGPGSIAARGDFNGIEAGKIAEKDVSAGKDVSYIDRAATLLRVRAEERLVLPVFTIDTALGTRNLNRLREYREYVQELIAANTAEETLYLMVESRFPGVLNNRELAALVRSPLRSQAFLYADSVLESLMYDGVFLVPSEGMDSYNPDYFELGRLKDGGASSEELPFSRMITISGLPGAVERELQDRHLARPLSGYTASLVLAFVTENGFFDEKQSGERLKRARERVEPVRRDVGKNELIIRKGDMVSDDDFARLMAVREAVSRADVGMLLSGLGLLVAAVVFGILVLGKEGLYGSRLDRGLGFVTMGSALAFLIAVLAVNGAATGRSPLDGAYFLPASLFVGLAAAVSGTRFGVLYSMLLALLAAAGSNLNAHIVLMVLLSGIAASLTVSTASSRISLVKAAVLQTGVQALLALVLTVQSGLSFRTILGIAGLQAFNGFVGGSLIVAILPILEQTLNIPTRFRLMELSDLNAPALKQLLTIAPGTYSHSVNVAHLAESAARDIGADPLLARVGAYYHDIGKIDQPTYFVENQEGVNRHDDINPRLSATVIRSHVKLGQERARELGLPQAVVDIVAQHHGNSVIVWFYEKARKADPNVSVEDFSYPGDPPSSREAGVVMLADSVEASTRTLKKPTLPRLEEFIRQIIMDKVSSGQLDDCSLTMKDLETVRHSFTRILAGHFHSRIEYPKSKDKEK